MASGSLLYSSWLSQILLVANFGKGSGKVLIINAALLRTAREGVPAQTVDATLACSLLAGVWTPKVFLGRVLVVGVQHHHNIRTPRERSPVAGLLVAAVTRLRS